MMVSLPSDAVDKSYTSSIQITLACGYPFVAGDIHWTPKVALRMVPAAVGAGIAAGLLGIGGGMILGPLFVALNFQPQAISPA